MDVFTMTEEVLSSILVANMNIIHLSVYFSSMRGGKRIKRVDRGGGSSASYKFHFLEYMII